MNALQSLLILGLDSRLDFETEDHNALYTFEGSFEVVGDDVYLLELVGVGSSTPFW